jgi:thioredoxin reductase
MTDSFEIAVIGSGPAGLSAACHAAELGVSHVLLEAAPHLSNTLFRYQKGKHVMDEPGVLPFGAEVRSVQRQGDHFLLSYGQGQQVRARHVVLGIGMQGNLRKLDVPGDDLPGVQYQLDDPGAYSGETIVVVGAGDAAIENALALSRHNDVIMVNRRDEFARAKEGNLRLVLRAIEDGHIQCYYNAAPEQVEALRVGRKPLRLHLATQHGKSQLLCDRVIARLGAAAPRAFVEQCGVQFPSKDPNAVPVISERYESNVPGLYIVGALAGYPLIKQAMNQGYEVVEFILGRTVEPADESLLKAKFRNVAGISSVNALLARIQSRVPLLSRITPLQLREFLIDSDIRTPRPGEVVFKRNDYTNSFFSIVDGEVAVLVNETGDQKIMLKPGEFFGEMGLISGRRRSATVVAQSNALLIETPRRSMNKLIQSVDAVKREVDAGKQPGFRCGVGRVSRDPSIQGWRVVVQRR